MLTNSIFHSPYSPAIHTHTWQFLISFGWLFHISMCRYIKRKHIRDEHTLTTSYQLKQKHFAMISLLIMETKAIWVHILYYTYLPSYPAFSSCRRRRLASFATSISTIHNVVAPTRQPHPQPPTLHQHPNVFLWMLQTIKNQFRIVCISHILAWLYSVHVNCIRYRYYYNIA